MHHAHRFPATYRLAALPIALALLLGGAVLQGCETAVADAGPVSLQTREALDVLPTDAAMVGMMDLKAARESGVVEALTGDALGSFGAQGGPELDAFVRVTGFDPGRDIDRVYVAGTEADGPSGLVVYARFDRDRIERYIAENSPEELTRSEIEGVPVYVGRDGGRSFALALVNDGMAVAGTEEAVTAMLGRIRTGAPGLSADAELSALIAKAQHRDGAWFAVRGMDAAGSDATGDPMGQAARLTDDMVVSFGFGRDGIDIDAFAVPRAGTDAGDMADLVRGAVAGMRATAKAEPALMRALDAVEVRETGGGVRVEGFLADEMLAEMRRDGPRRPAGTDA